jgi:hypothetical protein
VGGPGTARHDIESVKATHQEEKIKRDIKGDLRTVRGEKYYSYIGVGGKIIV